MTSIMGVAPYVAINFTSYETLKRFVQLDFEFSVLILATDGLPTNHGPRQYQKV